MTKDLDGKRIDVTCVFGGYKRTKGFLGHWELKYMVYNVRTEDDRLLSEQYTYSNLKAFKRKGYKNGDKLKMTVTVKVYGDEIKLQRPSNVVKI